jgi:hypothetical protein
MANKNPVRAGMLEHDLKMAAIHRETAEALEELQCKFFAERNGGSTAEPKLSPAATKINPAPRVNREGTGALERLWRMGPVT